PFEHAVFEGVQKVPPAGVVEWTPGAGLRVGRYWAPPDQPVQFEGDALPEVERLLRQAVRRRLESDVPLGVFLSAGFDSGLVAALAAQESGRPLVAVTAGTIGTGYDARDDAALFAMQYGLDQRGLVISVVTRVA